MLVDFFFRFFYSHKPTMIHDLEERIDRCINEIHANDTFMLNGHGSFQQKIVFVPGKLWKTIYPICYSTHNRKMHFLKYQWKIQMLKYTIKIQFFIINLYFISNDFLPKFWLFLEDTATSIQGALQVLIKSLFAIVAILLSERSFIISAVTKYL